MSLVNDPERCPTQVREDEMPEHWQKELEALEEEPRRRPSRFRLFVLLLIFAGPEVVNDFETPTWRI